MTKNRQEAFGDLNKKAKDADSNAQNGAEGAKEGAEGAGEGEGENGSQGGSKDSKGNPGKTHTDAEVDEIVKERIARERKKWEKAIEDEKNAATEAEKLKSMTEQQKAEYENQKLQKEIAELKREKNLNEQMAVARKSLADEGIKVSDKLLSMFVSPEAEKTKAAIDDFIPLWREAVNGAVQEALKGYTPKADKGQGQVKSDGAKAADKYNQKFQTGGN